MLGLTIVLLLGCGSSDGRHELEGTVTLDGEPLREGSIVFQPMPGTQSPTAGAPIRDGRFEVAAGGGAHPGEFRVEITAIRGTGKRRMDPMVGREIEVTEQYLPARYNRRSELMAQVSSSGSNHFEFDLHSD